MSIDCPLADEFADEAGWVAPSLAKLEADLCRTQSKAYAPGTIRNLACQWRSFRRFSVTYNIFDWPVKVHTICLYTQYLAYTFHSAKSVHNYISGVRKLHVLMIYSTKSSRHRNTNHIFRTEQESHFTDQTSVAYDTRYLVGHSILFRF